MSTAMSSDSDTDVEWPEEVDDYVKECELSSGMFSTVVLAHVRGAVRQKAVLKARGLVGLDDYRDRLCLADVKALTKLDHPNIIECYTFIEEEDGCWGQEDARGDQRDSQERARLVLVLEYADRGNLEQLIKDTYLTKQKRLPEAQIWRLFAQIAAAIAHVHEKRILHRDLKPAKVLLHGPQLTVKVSDFGMCRLFSPNSARADTQLGTPYYMCPERVTQSDYSFASDVWSMGCILYEMTCGDSMFWSETTNKFALYKHIETANFPPLPDHEQRTPHHKLLVRLCLQLDFGRRPTAAQLQRFADKMDVVLRAGVTAFRVGWPLALVALRSAEHLLRGASRACGYLDAVYRALHCDFARVWCEEYELMCADRCSFTSAALDDRE
ncbi:Serine/threonine-protein kinase Nek6 [Aphelenchoides fujianensis]|nr:Serine/threonine-protein kinase Nek6 [Aphelenchoides fujianensis]